MKPYLTDEEIAEITKPLTQGAARIKFFERSGVYVTARPNGQPLVGRAAFEESRRGRAQAANDAGTSSANVIALKNKVAKLRGKRDRSQANA